MIQFSRSIRQTYPSKLVQIVSYFRYRKNRRSNAIFRIKRTPLEKKKKRYSKFSDRVETWKEFFQLLVVAQLLEEIFEPRQTFREEVWRTRSTLNKKIFLHRLTFFFPSSQESYPFRERNVPGSREFACFRFETYSVPYNWRTGRNFASNGSVDCGKTLPSLSN